MALVRSATLEYSEYLKKWIQSVWVSLRGLMEILKPFKMMLNRICVGFMAGYP